jgi:tight adherence protein C
LLKWLVDWETRRAGEKQDTSRAAQQLESLLGYAGFTNVQRVAVYRAIRWLTATLLALLGIIAGMMLGKGALLPGLVAAAIGYVIPGTYVRRLARKRQLKIVRELPSVLDLLTVCLESGVSLNESLRMAGRETARQGYVLGTELELTYSQIEAGLSFAEALKQFGERTGVDDIKSLAALVIQSNNMGTRVVPALRASGDHLTTNRRMRAEELAQKSAIKMLFPLVVLVLPAMLMVILGPALIQLLQVLAN